MTNKIIRVFEITIQPVVMYVAPLGLVQLAPLLLIEKTYTCSLVPSSMG